MSLFVHLFLLAIAIAIVCHLVCWWAEHVATAAELSGDHTSDAEVIRRLMDEHAGGGQ